MVEEVLSIAVSKPLLMTRKKIPIITHPVERAGQSVTVAAQEVTVTISVL